MYIVRGAAWRCLSASGCPGSAAHSAAGNVWSVCQNRMLWALTCTDPLMNLNPTNITREVSPCRTRSPLAWSTTTPPADCETSTSHPLSGPLVAGCGALTAPAEYVPFGTTTARSPGDVMRSVIEPDAGRDPVT